MSRAVSAIQLGSAASYRMVERVLAPLAPDEVRIRIAATGVSFADLLIAAGKYQVVPPLPYIPGTECAGIVEAVGSEVTDLAPGAKVAARAFGGLFAEQANLPRASVSEVPANLELDEAAVMMLSYATAWHALHQRGNLKRGETLLVLGCAGGTGHAAVQIGKYIGARVVGSASSEDKRALARKAGADAVIDSRSSTWREDLRAANEGRPIDVVFDPVGGSLSELAFRSLAWRGRHLVIGFTDGIASLRTNLPLLKGSSLVGVDVRQFEKFEPAVFSENLASILSLAAQGILWPAIGQRFALSNFAAAMDAVATGQIAGRIIINP